MVIIREIVACGPITIAPEVPNAVALVLRVEYQRRDANDRECRCADNRGIVSQRLQTAKINARKVIHSSMTQLVTETIFTNCRRPHQPSIQPKSDLQSDRASEHRP